MNEYMRMADRMYDLENQMKQFEKENAELKNRDCWKSCEYANPKAELIGQHIKDVQNLTKAKKLLKRYVKIYVNPYPEEEIELKNEAEQFLSEVEK